MTDCFSDDIIIFVKYVIVCLLSVQYQINLIRDLTKITGFRLGIEPISVDKFFLLRTIKTYFLTIIISRIL